MFDIIPGDVVSSNILAAAAALLQVCVHCWLCMLTKEGSVVLRVLCARLRAAQQAQSATRLTLFLLCRGRWTLQRRWWCTHVPP